MISRKDSLVGVLDAATISSSPVCIKQWPR